MSGDQSGTVSGAGDINNDGCDDLIIGTPYANSGTGVSYVVFGDIPPVLVNNTLKVYAGSPVFLDSSHLAAYDLNHNNKTLAFIPSDVTHGYFQQVDQFIHDGTQIAPSYSITVRSAGIAWTGPQPANITFEAPLSIQTNQLVINQGCLGYISQREYNEYVGAVSAVVAAMETRGVLHPDSWHTLLRPQKQRIIDAIATQTKQIVANNRCCSTRLFTGFYKAEITPKRLRDKPDQIAIAVQKSLSEERESKTSRSLDVGLMRIDSSLNKTPSSESQLQLLN